jgi:hypothetical protein
MAIGPEKDPGRPRRKPATKDLIRRNLGKRVRIRSPWFSDRYKVMTWDGAEVLISDDEIQVLMGGDDIRRGVTLLAQEMWGSIVAYGSREEIMSWAAHGEAWGVPVRPGIKRGWFWRLVMTVLALDGCLNMIFGDGSGFSVVVAALAILWLMKRSAKKEEQRLAAEIGFHFPRTQGNAKPAADEDLEREGWL